MKHTLLSLMYVFSYVAAWAIVFGIPWWICKRAGKQENPFVVPRFLQSVLLVWAALASFEFLFGHPIAMARAEERGDLMHDGELGFILLGGWIFGLFGTTMSFLVYRLIQSVKARNDDSPKKL